jgi:Zn-dependent protease
MNEIAGPMIVLAGWIFSICLHEFGHAIVAYWGGDTTVKDKGYLTFNPLRYTDPGLSIVLPIIFLLLGGVALPGAAVYINQSFLRNRLWRSLVSLAGPLMSLVAALLFSLPILLMANSNGLTLFATSCITLTLLNIIAVMLNILPVPGLDGYGLIEPWLPAFVSRPLRQFSNIGMILLIALLWFNDSANRWFWQTGFGAASALLKVPPSVVSTCFQYFVSQKTALVVITVVGLMLMNLFKPKVSKAS